MKLADLIALGTAPNDANTTYKKAKAIQAFLSKINQLEVGRIVVQTFQAAPSRAFKVAITPEPLTAFDELQMVQVLEDGPLADDFFGEIYLFLGGPVPDYHNVRAIEKTLTGYGNIQNGLRTFLDQFSVAFDPDRAVFLSAAVTAALAKAWNEANGIVDPEPEVVPVPVDPPVYVPPSGLVGEPNIGGRYNANPGSEVLEIGAQVTEARGVFTYMGGYFMRNI